MCFIIAFCNGPMLCKGHKKTNTGRLDNQIIMSLASSLQLTYILHCYWSNWSEQYKNALPSHILISYCLLWKAQEHSLIHLRAVNISLSLLLAITSKKKKKNTSSCSLCQHLQCLADNEQEWMTYGLSCHFLTVWSSLIFFFLSSAVMRGTWDHVCKALCTQWQ